MAVDDMPYWATFSIFDFKTPRFRQALVLFDRIVVPIPDGPIKSMSSDGEITTEDLDRLSADVGYLSSAGAAIELKWNRDEFEIWRQSVSAEALAQLLDRDRELATRIHVQQVIDMALKAKALIVGDLHDSLPVSKATVVPVYADVLDYEASLREAIADAQVIQIVSAELPMPADDEPLEKIVELRSRDSFRAFMPAFRTWQEEIALRLLKAGEDDVIRRRELRLATRQLHAAIEKFTKAVEDVKFKKLKRGITLPLVIGQAAFGHVKPLIDTVIEEGPEVLNVREIVQPWWRSIEESEFALAGVICEARRR